MFQPPAPVAWVRQSRFVPPGTHRWPEPAPLPNAFLPHVETQPEPPPDSGRLAKLSAWLRERLRRSAR